MPVHFLHLSRNMTSGTMRLPLLLLVLWLTRLSPAEAQLADTDEVPAFNDLYARTMIIEILPLVEKHTGWKIADLPRFRLVTREQYGKAMAQEIAPLLREREPALSEAHALAAAESAARAQAAGLLGKYSALSGTIFLLPGNLQPTVRRMGVEHRFVRDLIEVIIAHEMTHTAQDRRHPSRAMLGACPDDEARDAYAMLTEGHAMFIQERIAAELRLNEAAAQLAQRMLEETVSGKASWGRYLAGKKFVQAAYARGGLLLVQRLFLRPPRTRGQVLEPETYFLTEGRALLAELESR
jgi:hypothetical protein